MATSRDYYEILGLEKSASEEDIKRAYRTMAKQYHPDRNPDNPGAAEMFKEATEAYEVLKDPQKRQLYDQFGHAGLRGGAGGGGFGYESFDIADALRAFMRDFGGFGGGFEDMFGFGSRGRSGGRRVFRGEDLRVAVRVTLEEVAEGVEKKLKINVKDKCPDCEGSGAAGGSERTSCPQCNGAGEVQRVSQSLLGRFVRVQPCDYCRGTGSIVTNPCDECGGEGRKTVQRTITIKVPGGVSSGNFMTLQGSGNVGPHGGPPGNIEVVFEEEEHELFERHGDDILTEVPISFTQAALGTAVDVPTLTGTESLKIPAGTQSGKLFRFRNKGVKHLRSAGRGSQIVRVVVWTPTRLDKRSKSLLEDLAKIEGISPPKPTKSFFRRLKESLGV